MHYLCIRVHCGRSRSPKVVDFGSSRKGIWDFVLVINSNLGPSLAPFLRYVDLLVENRQFSLPFCHLVLLIWVIPFEFLEKLYGY